MDLRQVINNLKQLADYCDGVVSGNVSHKIAHLKYGIINISESLELNAKALELGWHPASELPKENGEYITIMSNSLGEHGEICFNDFSNGEWRYTGYDWEPREVLLWCYPPKEDKK